MLFRPYVIDNRRECVLRAVFLKLHPLYAFTGKLCADRVSPQQKGSLYQETVRPGPQHKETPRSAHLCAGEYLQPAIFA